MPAMSALQRERLDDGIEVLRLDRPGSRNAMDTGLLAELDAAMASLAADYQGRALVFSTTSTDALSAGADVREELDPAGGVARMQAFARMYAAVEDFPAPTIAVCVGNTVGAGAELAAGCDLRVAGENLKLAWPGGRLGVPVGPARLVPLVGLSRAKELIFTGRTVGAAEAEALGLVAARVPADEAEAAALALARTLAAQPAPGLRHLKRLFAEYEGTRYRVLRENAEIVAFQREGAGIPYRP